VLQIVVPLSFVDLTFLGDELSLAVCPSEEPLAFVPGTICENNLTLSVTETTQPLAFIHVPTFDVLVAVVYKTLLQGFLIFRVEQSTDDCSLF